MVMSVLTSLIKTLTKKHLAKAASKTKKDKHSHSFNSRQGTDKDTSTMRASPTTMSPHGVYKYGVDDSSKSLHRGKKQSERFKKESGYFKKDRRKSKQDRRD